MVLPGCLECCRLLLACAAVHDAPGPTEADLIRYVGVAIAVAGALIATPDGTTRLWHQAADLGRRIRSGITRFLRLSRRNANVQANPVPATARFGGGDVTAQVITPWNSAAPDTDKIEFLREQVEQLKQDVANISQDIRERDAALQAAISQTESNLRGADQQLTRRLDASEQRAARVDARGIWPIGLGILLSGIPGELADVRALGIVVMVLAVAVTLNATFRVWRDN
jgi:hypothetical protein